MSPGGNGLFMEPARHSNPAVPASVLHATEDSITTPPAVMARPGSMMTWAEAGAAPIITMRAPAINNTIMRLMRICFFYGNSH